MNGYSKMVKASTTTTTTKSRSMDLSTLSSSHDDATPPIKPQSDDRREEGESFGVILRRNCSSASQRFRDASGDDKVGPLQAAVRRAFSMRKPPSASVGEGYWRIHDSTGDAADVDRAIQEEEGERSSARIKKRGRIFRACKRLFKF